MLRQLSVFFILAYLISWLIWLPLYFPALTGTEIPSFPFQHAFGGFGPFMSAIITTVLFQPKQRLKELLKACVKTGPITYLLIALLSPFLLGGIAMVADYWMNGTKVDLSAFTRVKEFPQFSFVSFFIYNLIFFGFGEEVGWRGFALPRFQQKFSALTSSLILTLFWAAWHIPLFLYRPGYVDMDMAGIIGWLFSLLTGSVLLTWLFNSTRGSIMVCAVFHATVDIAFTADFSSRNIVGYMGLLITIWGILTILLFKPARLSTQV